MNIQIKINIKNKNTIYARIFNEKIGFGNSSTNVKCIVCGNILIEPTGGKSKIKARILEVL